MKSVVGLYGFQYRSVKDFPNRLRLDRGLHK